MTTINFDDFSIDFDAQNDDGKWEIIGDVGEMEAEPQTLFPDGVKVRN